ESVRLPWNATVPVPAATVRLLAPALVLLANVTFALLAVTLALRVTPPVAVTLTAPPLFQSPPMDAVPVWLSVMVPAAAGDVWIVPVDADVKFTPLEENVPPLVLMLPLRMTAPVPLALSPPLAWLAWRATLSLLLEEEMLTPAFSVMLFWAIS